MITYSETSLNFLLLLQIDASVVFRTQISKCVYPYLMDKNYQVDAR